MSKNKTEAADNSKVIVCPDLKNDKNLLVSLPPTEADLMADFNDMRSYLKEAEGFLPIVDVEEDKKNNKYKICYELGNYKQLGDEIDIKNFWVMRKVVKILKKLHDKGFPKSFIGKKTIFVDEKNWEVRIGFFGLKDILLKHQWTDIDCQNQNDEIYHLAKCFEHKENLPEIIRECLYGECGKEYEDLLKAMNTKDFHPPYNENQYVMIDKNISQDIVAHLNENDCYIEEWRDSKKDDKDDKDDKEAREAREAFFLTRRFKGKFIKNKTHQHFFIPFVNEGIYEPDGLLFKKKIKLTNEFKEEDEDYRHHGLIDYYKEKKEKVKRWKSVPEAEKDYIKKNAFGSRYDCVHQTEKEFKFILAKEEYSTFEKIENLRQRQKQAEANSLMVKSVNVGVFEDKKDYIIVNYPIENQKDKKLIVDNKQGARREIDFDFFTEEGRGGLFAIPYSEDINTFLDFLEEKKWHAVCIITKKDSSAEIEIPPKGILKENVKLEVIPYTRQIEAVEAFDDNREKNEWLAEILIKQKGFHFKPRGKKILKWENKELNEKQKEAVEAVLASETLHLIHGPPGTGKTTAIEEIIRQFLNKDPDLKILICSQTHVAVDNVLKRLPENNGRIRKVRLAGDDKKIDKEVKRFWFKNILYTWFKGIKRNCDKKNNIIKDIWLPFLEKYAVEKSDELSVRAYTERDWETLERLFLKSLNVIGSTCSHIASHQYEKIFGDTYDLLLIDEASKVMPSEALISMIKAKRIVLIGDHKQLPPYVNSQQEIWKQIQEAVDKEDEKIEELQKNLTESLFETLIKKLPDGYQVMLNEQWRMPKQIGDIVSKYFYDGTLKTPDNEKFKRDKAIDLPLKKSSAIFVISTSKNENRFDNGSPVKRENRHNIEVIIKTLKCLERREVKTEIAIIAGYKAQAEALEKRVRREIRNIKCNINTVDAFQGNENDIVIYDIVRSSKDGDSIGFLDEPRRLNVALSRAKKLLLIVGDSDFVRRAKPTKIFNPNSAAEKALLGEIIDDIDKQGLIVDKPEDIFE